MGHDLCPNGAGVNDSRVVRLASTRFRTDATRA
jgi:hypothetical protein